MVEQKAFPCAHCGKTTGDDSRAFIYYGPVPCEASAVKLRTNAVSSSPQFSHGQPFARFALVSSSNGVSRSALAVLVTVLLLVSPQTPVAAESGDECGGIDYSGYFQVEQITPGVESRADASAYAPFGHPAADTDVANIGDYDYGLWASALSAGELYGTMALGELDVTCGWDENSFKWSVTGSAYARGYSWEDPQTGETINYSAEGEATAFLQGITTFRTFANETYGSGYPMIGYYEYADECASTNLGIGGTSASAATGDLTQKWFIPGSFSLGWGDKRMGPGPEHSRIFQVGDEFTMGWSGQVWVRAWSNSSGDTATHRLDFQGWKTVHLRPAEPGRDMQLTLATQSNDTPPDFGADKPYSCAYVASANVLESLSRQHPELQMTSATDYFQALDRAFNNGTGLPPGEDGWKGMDRGQTYKALNAYLLGQTRPGASVSELQAVPYRLSTLPDELPRILANGGMALIGLKLEWISDGVVVDTAKHMIAVDGLMAVKAPQTDDEAVWMSVLDGWPDAKGVLLDQGGGLRSVAAFDRNWWPTPNLESGQPLLMAYEEEGVEPVVYNELLVHLDGHLFLAVENLRSTTRVCDYDFNADADGDGTVELPSLFAVETADPVSSVTTEAATEGGAVLRLYSDDGSQVAVEFALRTSDTMRVELEYSLTQGAVGELFLGDVLLATLAPSASVGPDVLEPYSSCFDLAEMGLNDQMPDFTIGLRGDDSSELYVDDLAIYAIVPEPSGMMTVVLGGWFIGRIGRRFSSHQ